MNTFEAGFDLTDFGSADTFQELLEALCLSEYQVRERGDGYDYKIFSWSNNLLCLETGNNPLTGEYCRENMQPNEKGYASYIGLTGEKRAVDEAIMQIRERATHIKGSCYDCREFI